MFELRQFELEDFFLDYEHREDLANLASSDARPWTLRELDAGRLGCGDAVSDVSLGYPDVKRILLPSLRRFSECPDGMDVLPTSGTAEAIFLSLIGLRCKYGRQLRIAIPRPSYGAFDGISYLLGYDITHYMYRPDANWALDSHQLKALSAECDVTVINNPHNPTGSVIEGELLDRLVRNVGETGGTLLVDEVFRLPEDGESATRHGRQTIVIGSLSKVYGLPGLRLGWLVAPEELVERIRTLQQYTTLSLNSFAVALGAKVFDNPLLFAQGKLLRGNRHIVNQWASQHTTCLRVIPSSGGTTAILEIVSRISEEALFDAFLRKKVLLAPGKRCFDVRNNNAWFRLGYGATEDVLREGLKRIVAALHEV